MFDALHQKKNSSTYKGTRREARQRPSSKKEFLFMKRERKKKQK
jgi:hypothetical protein